MASLAESLLREYLEGQGFWVRALPTGQPTTRKRGRPSAGPAAEDDALVWRIGRAPPRPVTPSANFFLFELDLLGLNEAEIHWRARDVFDRPEARRLREQSRLLADFVRKRLLAPAAPPAPAPAGELFAGVWEPPAPPDAVFPALHGPRLVLLPAFPKDEPYRGEIQQALVGAGFGGALSWHSLLLDFVGRAHGHAALPANASEVRRFLALLAHYDLLRPPAQPSLPWR